MKVSKEKIKKIADMSKIIVHENEFEGLIKQMEDVLNYAACVQQVAADLVGQPSNKNINFLREDVAISFDSKAILDNAPEVEESLFVVPKILNSK